MMIANADLNTPTWIRLKSAGTSLNQISSLCERDDSDQVDYGSHPAEGRRDVLFEVIPKPELKHVHKSDRTRLKVARRRWPVRSARVSHDLLFGDVAGQKASLDQSAQNPKAIKADSSFHELTVELRR